MVLPRKIFHSFSPNLLSHEMDLTELTAEWGLDSPFVNGEGNKILLFRNDHKCLCFFFFFFSFWGIDSLHAMKPGS